MLKMQLKEAFFKFKNSLENKILQYLYKTGLRAVIH